jgi:PPM family protein phosphatase
MTHTVNEALQGSQVGDVVELPLLDFAVRSHPGRDPDKQVNEDAFVHCETPLGFLVVVCDGMGGHEGGKEASAVAVATLAGELEKARPTDSRPDCLRRAIELANERVFALGSRMASERVSARPGSTLIALLATDDGVLLAHVGDSRAYRFHSGRVEVATRDHSAVQALVDSGVLTVEQAKMHPEANKITRALGMANSVVVELSRGLFPFVPGDAFLLCSDGLSDLVDAAELLEIVAGSTSAHATGRLIDLANARGGHDNITAAVLRFRVPSRRAVAATEAEIRGPQLTEAMMPVVEATRPLVLPHAPSTPRLQERSAAQTVVMVPLATALGATAQGGASVQGVAVTVGVEHPAPADLRGHTTGAEAPKRWPLAVGMILAGVGLAALAYVVLTQLHKRDDHVTVPIPMPMPPPTAPADIAKPSSSPDLRR